jgi:hypothetical protein
LLLGKTDLLIQTDCVYGKSITATTVGEKRRLELWAAYEKTQELACVVPYMCTYIIEFAKLTETSARPQGL